MVRQTRSFFFDDEEHSPPPQFFEVIPIIPSDVSPNRSGVVEHVRTIDRSENWTAADLGPTYLPERLDVKIVLWMRQMHYS